MTANARYAQAPAQHSQSSQGFAHWHLPDLDLVAARLGVLVQVDVDGEMGVDISHLVLEALGDTDDEVVDDGPDGAESGDILAVAVVDLNADNVLLEDREVDGDMAHVLDELAAGALDCDKSRLDRDLDCRRTLRQQLPVSKFPKASRPHILAEPLQFLLAFSFGGS